MTSCDKQIKGINTEAISNNGLFTHKLVDSVDLDLFCQHFVALLQFQLIISTLE